MSKPAYKTSRLLDAYETYHKNELPPISPRTRNKGGLTDRLGGTLSPQKYMTHFPGKHLYPGVKPKGTLEDIKEDKTGILTILKDTKHEIVDQINELYKEGDPELFLQYAKTVSSQHPKLYLFDLYPTKPMEHPGAADAQDSDATSMMSAKVPQKLSKKYLTQIKKKYKQRKCAQLITR